MRASRRRVKEHLLHWFDNCRERSHFSSNRPGLWARLWLLFRSSFPLRIKATLQIPSPGVRRRAWIWDGSAPGSACGPVRLPLYRSEHQYRLVIGLGSGTTHGCRTADLLPNLYRHRGLRRQRHRSHRPHYQRNGGRDRRVARRRFRIEFSGVARICT